MGHLVRRIITLLDPTVRSLPALAIPQGQRILTPDNALRHGWNAHLPAIRVRETGPICGLWILILKNIHFPQTTHIQSWDIRTHVAMGKVANT